MKCWWWEQLHLNIILSIKSKLCLKLLSCISFKNCFCISHLMSSPQQSWEKSNITDYNMCAYLVAKWCLTLCDPMDCSLPGSSVHGIFQARILEWVAIPYSRASSRPRGWTHFSCTSCIGWQILYHCATCNRQIIIWARKPNPGFNKTV